MEVSGSIKANTFYFVGNVGEVVAVFAPGQCHHQFFQSRRGNKAAMKSGLFRTAEFHALAFFGGLHIGWGFVQAATAQVFFVHIGEKTGAFRLKMSLTLR